MLIAGVDEAGRGAVLGPLVLCVFAIDEDASDRLKQMGVKDSKLLSDKERERLADIITHYPHELQIVSAHEITEYMKKKISINEMEAEKIADGLRLLHARVRNIGAVYVDSPDPLPRKFEIRIRKYLKGSAIENIKIISENKADFRYPVVGAASIMAKSTREKEVLAMKKELGDFGAGYPSDEKTIEFIRKNLKTAKLQKYIRHRWETIQRMKTTELKLEEFF
ncbi:ribonuclease HII [Candidatus Micrarchaeota archaeon]|nr:ribonuclease HII [Candidatus Micrarchaeota archaeon]